jgi:hypothetical protein
MPVMMFIPLNIALFIAERVLRLYLIMLNKDNDILTLYGVWFYQIIFWIRNVVLVIIFAASLKCAI